MIFYRRVKKMGKQKIEERRAIKVLINQVKALEKR